MPAVVRGLPFGCGPGTRALADGQLLRIEALVGGRPYDQYTDVSSAAFQPLLANVNFSLDEGDVAVGVVFDLPARHGQLVLRNADLHKVAAWTY